MKTFGIGSYNIHCNFMNYGAALQSWGLRRTIEWLGYKTRGMGMLEGPDDLF